MCHILSDLKSYFFAIFLVENSKCRVPVHGNRRKCTSVTPSPTTKQLESKSFYIETNRISFRSLTESTMNPKDSNEDQTNSNSPNVDDPKCAQKPPDGVNEVDSKPLKKEFVGDIKREDIGPEMNLMDILGEEQDDEIRKLLFGVCRTLHREYGDIANSLIPQFIEFVREHEYNVDLETLTEELQCTVSESEFIEHFASRFPSVFGTDSEKQKLQKLLSSCSPASTPLNDENDQFINVSTGSGMFIVCISFS